MKLFMRFASILFVFCILFLSAANAATYTVANTNDAGGGSLRQAILDAEGNAGADTINVAVAGTVNLTSDLPTITQNLTINGGSQTGFIVSGQGNILRPFTVNAGSTIAVSINNLTVTGGSGGFSGGGIFIGGGAAVTLTGVSVANNQLSSGGSGTGGAGIAVSGSTLNLVNSRVAGNVALRGSGGGIRSDNSALTITNSVIESNSTDGTDIGDGYGGGIFASGGMLKMSGSTVSSNNSSNNAGRLGGGLYLSGVAARIENSSVFGNKVSDNTDGLSSGGGLYVTGGTLRASNLSVYSNSAATGGGLYLLDGDATLRNSTVAQNGSRVSSGRGGGIQSASSGAAQTVIRLANTIVAGNSATSSANGFDFYAQNTTVTLLTYNIVQNGIVGTGNTVGGAGTVGQVNPLFAGVECGQVCTVAIAANSPARNAGTNGEALDTNGAALTTDARGAGFPRISGGTVDLGAFEYQVAPTAASVSIGGRVLMANGRGISGVIVNLTDANGTTRSARTNPFGYYHFNDVTAGATYIFAARHKRFEFAPQVLTVAEQIDTLNFTAAQ